MAIRFRRSTKTASTKPRGITAEGASLRCPHCNEGTTIFGGTSLDEVFACPNCQGTFAFTADSTPHNLKVVGVGAPRNAAAKLQSRSRQT